ncbi:uncharacterized protein FOMMEDRAFT_98111 [Fomitiporia mediterranea MF3/22]|uniref:DUF7729 domain-containing protein n=1 Tax=Fomitiporia mediterranea (strain MF3/22) TaxID=694068 RepID=R7SHM3_FOMME|nr:uncharacterized protein FOMMEDRAFT_98111 [Fomitiporia mediterranea MF3/22]EJC97762.1 hypothetical protein FOMMEDRAFT_98111 [Fomitiporia mediterranea MF3/22]
MYHHKRQTLSLTNPAAPSSTILVTTPLVSISGSGAPSQTASPTTTVPQTEQTIPPVPDAANAPPLPTPFPQPYDSTGTNFVTTQTCANFFTNMTQSSAFRTCRPFSLLEQFSNDFIEAQENLTTLNALIYGTCNTDTPLSTCTANMNWFASSLTTSCADELKQKNSQNPVQQTLFGLQSYELLRNGSCLVNQASNTYCYAAAAHSSSPADLYLYQLPLGVPFPVNTTSPSCSTCAKTLLGLYADALQGSDGSSDGSGDGGSVDGLKATYEDAANQAETACGTGYALVGLASSAQGTRIGIPKMGMGRGMVLALMVWALVEVLVWL